MTAVRRPPMPESYDAARRKGACKFCGDPVLKDDGTPNRRKSWHRDCLDIYLFLTRPSVQREYVFERDQGRCCDCGEVEFRWVDQGPCTGCDGDGLNGRATLVDYRCIWHLDHRVPLWKINDLPDSERAFYFGVSSDFKTITLTNLDTRCEHDHGHKTKSEAGERAHIKRLAKPRKKSGRKIQGRGFDKTKTQKLPTKAKPYGDVVERRG